MTNKMTLTDGSKWLNVVLFIHGWTLKTVFSLFSGCLEKQPVAGWKRAATRH